MIKFFGPAESAFSIGYKVTPNGASHRGGIRYINDLDLFEVSTVLHGAARYATLLSVKGAPVLETKATTGVVAAQRRAGGPAATACSVCGRPAAAVVPGGLRTGESLICQRCIETVGETAATATITPEDLAELDHAGPELTSEEEYAAAVGAEQRWQLTADGELTEETDDDPARGRAWTGRARGAARGRP